MSRTYKCAPLPFMGQKRYFLRDFAEVLERVEGQIDTVVDLFGLICSFPTTYKYKHPKGKSRGQNAFDALWVLLLNVVGVAKLRKNAE